MSKKHESQEVKQVWIKTNLHSIDYSHDNYIDFFELTPPVKLQGDSH